MRDKLRHKIAYEIANNCFPALPHEQGWAYKIADSILSLIAGERCVWTRDGQRDGENVYLSSCDMVEFLQGYTFCPKCGKRIEVKNGQ